MLTSQLVVTQLPIQEGRRKRLPLISQQQVLSRIRTRLQVHQVKVALQAPMPPKANLILNLQGLALLVPIQLEQALLQALEILQSHQVLRQRGLVPQLGLQQVTTLLPKVATKGHSFCSQALAIQLATQLSSLLVLEQVGWRQPAPGLLTNHHSS